MTTPSEATTRKKIFRHPSPESGFMTRRQVADEFGCSESYLAHLPQSVLPRYTFGGRVIYERAEVIAAIKGGMPVIKLQRGKTGTRGRPRKTPISETR
jgi:hypothetical protein